MLTYLLFTLFSECVKGGECGSFFACSGVISTADPQNERAQPLGVPGCAGCQADQACVGPTTTDVDGLLLSGCAPLCDSCGDRGSCANGFCVQGGVGCFTGGSGPSFCTDHVPESCELIFQDETTCTGQS